MKKNKEFKKRKSQQNTLERQADKILKRDEEFQKLKSQGSKIDVDKFKKLL